MSDREPATPIAIDGWPAVSILGAAISPLALLIRAGASQYKYKVRIRT